MKIRFFMLSLLTNYLFVSLFAEPTHQNVKNKDSFNGVANDGFKRNESFFYAHIIFHFDYFACISYNRDFYCENNCLLLSANKNMN